VVIGFQWGSGIDAAAGYSNDDLASTRMPFYTIRFVGERFSRPDDVIDSSLEGCGNSKVVYGSSDDNDIGSKKFCNEFIRDSKRLLMSFGVIFRWRESAHNPNKINAREGDLARSRSITLPFGFLAFQATTTSEVSLRETEQLPRGLELIWSRVFMKSPYTDLGVGHMRRMSDSDGLHFRP